MEAEKIPASSNNLSLHTACTGNMIGVEIKTYREDTALKIEAPQENKIIVELTQEDMNELDITYEEMDYGNIETRRVIWTILDRARHTLSRDIDPSGRMLIETVPTAQGGCVIFFTVLGKEIKTANFRRMMQIRKEPTAFTYVFDSLDTLTRCAAQLRRAEPILPKSSLFLLDGQYRLSVRSELPPHRFKAVLSEYGTPCPDGELSLAFLQEHGKLLADGDAIEKLTIGL